MSYTLVSNHAPKKQVFYDKENIQTSISKSRGYPNSHIVNRTINERGLRFILKNLSKACVSSSNIFNLV